MSLFNMKLEAIIVLVAVGIAFSAIPCEECGPYEEFKECGTACPETCETLGEDLPCVKLCVRGCFCQDGYVKNNQSQECVLPCDCPPKATTITPEPTETTCV